MVSSANANQFNQHCVNAWHHAFISFVTQTAVPPLPPVLNKIRLRLATTLPRRCPAGLHTWVRSHHRPYSLSHFSTEPSLSPTVFDRVFLRLSDLRASLPTLTRLRPFNFSNHQHIHVHHYIIPMRAWIFVVLHSSKLQSFPFRRPRPRHLLLGRFHSRKSRNRSAFFELQSISPGLNLEKRLELLDWDKRWLVKDESMHLVVSYFRFNVAAVFLRADTLSELRV